MNKSRHNATVSNINLLMRFCRLFNANPIGFKPLNIKRLEEHLLVSMKELVIILSHLIGLCVIKRESFRVIYIFSSVLYFHYKMVGNLYNL